MDQNMTQGKVFPILIKFAVPIFIGNIFQQLYNMADTLIVGRFVGEKALAAVGSTGTIMFLIFSFFHRTYFRFYSSYLSIIWS
jgi:Na+-driven multidrug efflux pump